MNEFFKVYDSMVKYGYFENLFQLAAHKEMGQNGVDRYIKFLYEQTEILNNQINYNSHEKTEFISIITNLNMEIISLKEQIDRLNYSIANPIPNLPIPNLIANPIINQTPKTPYEIDEITELKEQLEIQQSENKELIETRIRLQKSNAYWINTIYRFMMKTSSIRQKYFKEIQEMQTLIINNYKDTPRVVERTKEIINEFFQK